jgi:hypothetical protein
MYTSSRCAELNERIRQLKLSSSAARRDLLGVEHLAAGLRLVAEEEELRRDLLGLARPEHDAVRLD